MQNKQYVVFIVVAGNYDKITVPSVIDSRFDYILFSDTIKEEKVGCWHVRPIPYETDKQWLKGRYPRFNPEQLLLEYKGWLYVDGNVHILSPAVYDRCIELADRGVEWASIKHQGRNGLFQEINAIVGLGWVHDYEVIDWYRYMKRDGYPNDNGIFEDNIIFRLNCENVHQVDKHLWWAMEKYEMRRDQFILMWAIWKVPGLKTECFLPENENAWHNSGWFECVAHNPHKRVLDQTLWEKMRNRYVHMFYASGGWEIYYTRWFDKLIKWPFPHLAMHLWTAGMMIRYDMGFLLKRMWNRMTGRKNTEN